jgi:HK97 family phage major capsid protein
MQAVTKTVTASVRSLADDSGSFEMVLSTDALDRDGDRIFAYQWRPLPTTIPLKANHSRDVADIVGSGEPYIDADGNLRVTGRFSSSPLAQHVRTLVTEGHVQSVSAEFLHHDDDTNELLAGAFCDIPSNPEARVLAAKSQSSQGGTIMGSNPRLEQVRQAADAAYGDLIAGKITTKEFNVALGRMERDVEALHVQELNRKKARQYAGSADSAPDAGWASRGKDLRDKGRGPSLILTDQQCREMHAKAMNGESTTVRVKDYTGDSDLGYSGVGLEGQVPAQLAPWITQKVHERRIMDRLPSTAVDAPSFEIIQHTGTTGFPEIVAEGARKPEIKLVTTALVLPMLKLAAHSALTWEIISDVDLMTSYLQRELPLEIVDQENYEILYGTGGSTSIAGLATTTGILTDTISAFGVSGSGSTLTSALDNIEEAIESLRSGPALATADLFIVSPSSWSALRRIKDGFGHFMVQPDPTQGAADTIWGVPVLQTTACAIGDGFLLDTTKFGKVLVREGLTVRQGLAEDDFVSNRLRWVWEERFNLAVERPSAVLKLSGLPYTANFGPGS